MAKIIIWLAGNPKVHGYKKREFTWSEPHGCYLYRGVEYTLADFNAAYERALKTNADLLPRVKVLLPAGPSEDTPLTDDQMLEQAEAVFLRLDPTRLKKKTGPQSGKPQLLEVE